MSDQVTMLQAGDWTALVMCVSCLLQQLGLQEMQMEQQYTALLASSAAIAAAAGRRCT